MISKHMLYTVADIRKIELAACALLPSGSLMQRAGKAVAEFSRQLLKEIDADPVVLVLAGPGNNGGDALEAASQLANAGLKVSVILAGDPEKMPSDARQALQRARTSDITFLDSTAHSRLRATDWTLVIDGLFGIGLTRAITDTTYALIETINASCCSVLSLDVPSGLDADTGAIAGASAGIAIQATNTITFIGDKPGLHTCNGRDYAGKVCVADLDIDPALFFPSQIQLNHIGLFCGALHPRRHNSHKGSYGDVSILGGAHGMVGAAILAARTAARCGAGRVFVACINDALDYDSAQPELMCRPARDLDFDGTTTVAGPGLGTSRDAHDFLAKAISAHTPLVLDADALNLISEESGLQQKLAMRQARNALTLLTPHPLEAARLLDISSQQVQADRLAAAHSLAKKFNATTILKGSGTVIASPGGDAIINITGNPALATAGSGDVLSGLCGALLAQHCPAREAALAAVWLHGMAADNLVERGIGPIGVTASELIPEIRLALNRLVNQHAAKPTEFRPDALPRS